MLPFVERLKITSLNYFCHKNFGKNTNGFDHIIFLKAVNNGSCKHEPKVLVECIQLNYDSLYFVDRNRSYFWCYKICIRCFFLYVLLLPQISRNITTNEMANALRYNYLRGSDGRFRNPYDHGCKRNCSDFLIKGYNEDVEYVEPSIQTEGLTMMNMMRNSPLRNRDVHSLHINGNGHTAINVDSEPKTHQGHIHSSHCSHGGSNHQKPKSDKVPLGLGLGLGLGRNSSHALAAA